MIFPDAGLVHLPSDGHLHLADTTRPHTVMNGHSHLERVHLVFSLCEARPQFFHEAQSSLGFE